MNNQNLIKFTPETAKIFGARGSQVRWQRYREAKAREAEAKTPEAFIRYSREDSYQDKIKGRVRKQIERLLDMVEGTDDPADEKQAQRLDRITAAFDRLMEIERKLDMRPAPATVKPSRKQERQNPGPDLS